MSTIVGRGPVTGLLVLHKLQKKAHMPHAESAMTGLKSTMRALVPWQESGPLSNSLRVSLPRGFSVDVHVVGVVGGSVMMSVLLAWLTGLE